MGLTRINKRGRAMRYKIDSEELSEFLARQVRLVECLPVQAAEAAADGYGDGLDDAEREAVWLAAGIATFIGRCASATAMTAASVGHVRPRYRAVVTVLACTGLRRSGCAGPISTSSRAN